MLFIGIDAASNNHEAAITTLHGEVLTEPFTIPNNISGFKKLRSEIYSHTEHHNNVRIGIEETGIYHKNITEFLALCGFTVHTINAVLTSHSRKSQSVRLTKTDKIDALSICRYLEFNFKRLNSYTPSLYINEELKSLSRARFDVQNKLSKAKTEYTRLIDLSFPEFKQHFNQHSKWSYKLLSQYPSADKISRAHLKTLIKIIAIKGDRTAAANQLKSIAKNSIGSQSVTNELLLTNVLEDIKHFTSQAKRFENAISKIVEEHYENILSIPGIGNITAGLIIGEIGDISRFKSSSALLAYAGLDPIVHQSGKFKATKVNISKRGSAYLRTAIFTSTRVACVSPNIPDNKFRTKYYKKLNQGKHDHSAICHACKNMVNVIFALLKSGDFYKFDY